MKKIPYNLATVKTSSPSKTAIILEPWGLGDAIIALMGVRVFIPQFRQTYFVCNPRWSKLIQTLIERFHLAITLVSLDLDYTSKSKNYSQLIHLKEVETLKEANFIFSIRGDIRDYMVAKKIAPNALPVFCGWIAFLLRRFRLLDFVFQYFHYPVKNRYETWKELLNTIQPTKVEQPVGTPKIERTKKKISIHLGAQWRSKAYPYFEQLHQELTSMGFQVDFLCGPNESHLSPKNILAKEVKDEELISQCLESRFLICNDSSPLHLAAALDIPTLTIVRASNIKEWQPPNAISISSTKMPNGYCPDKNYNSEKTLDSWPEVLSVMKCLKENQWI